MPSTQITVGTTPANIYDLIKGETPPSGASISQTYPGLPLGNGCQHLDIQADDDNGGTVYIGDDSSVSATNKGIELSAGQAMSREFGSGGYNGIRLNRWIVGSGAGQVVNVNWEYA
jgi:hypothetical protein